ncbi:flagellar hook-length control protein FliK [Sporosalibacterium faouarense]|uniref:flagellar hook-length control protein FliK n=1 Tax=Sporosalibacterium faouarense TaxID=516123 RepID=UPI001FAF8072|nr:flagellar hook-length control protein FliK [Sporosalibacterium faouarense]
MAFNLINNIGSRSSSVKNSSSRRDNSSKNNFESIFERRTSSLEENNSQVDRKRKPTSTSVKGKNLTDKEESEATDRKELHRTDDTTNSNEKSGSAKSTNSSKETKTDKTKELEDKHEINIEDKADEIQDSIINLLNSLSQEELSNNLGGLDVESIKGKLQQILSQFEENQGSQDMLQFQNIVKELKNILNSLITQIDASKIESGQAENFTAIIDKLNKTLDSSENSKKNTSKSDSSFVENLRIDDDNYNEKASQLSKKEDASNNSQGQSDKSFDGGEKIKVLNESTLSKTDNGDNKVFFQQVAEGEVSTKAVKDTHTQLSNLSNKAHDIDKNDLIKQIVSKVKINTNSNSSQIKISLKPEILGEMSLKLSMDEGVISAKAIVQDQQVKQLIESNLNQLRENLEEQGINITNFEVSVGDDSNFQRHNGHNWNHKRSRRIGRIASVKNEYNQYLDDTTEVGVAGSKDNMMIGNSTINLQA